MAGGLHSLATIIKRLEAATSRIEDVANLYKPNGTTGSEDSFFPDERKPATAAPAPPAPPPAFNIADVPESVKAFDEDVISAKLKPFVELTKALTGPPVIDIVGLIDKQYYDLRGFLHVTACCFKPTNPRTMEALLAPLQSGIEATIRSKEAGRENREWFTHISFIGEAANSVGWVVNPKPPSYVSEIKDSVVYYGNKIMQDYKTKDPKHVEWVKAFLTFLDECRKYVAEYHTMGLSWNTKGISVDAYKAAASGTPPSQSSSSTPSAPLPPPPPPPPPAMTMPASVSDATQAGGGVSAVFAQLNRGEEVTKGLRKVDSSEMTHKNPALRAGGAVGGGASTKKPVRPSKPQSLAGKKPAKFVLEGSKWVIEYQENEHSLAVEDAGLSQSINLFGCKNCTVVVKGKVNAVTIANCQSISVLVDSVVSSISITRAPSFKLQILGSAPMLQLDSSDSGQIFLSKESLGIEITTAKCSAINVSLPVEGEEEGVFGEEPLPEMLKTIVKDGKLVTSVVEHTG